MICILDVYEDNTAINVYIVTVGNDLKVVFLMPGHDSGRTRVHFHDEDLVLVSFDHALRRLSGEHTVRAR